MQPCKWLGFQFRQGEHVGEQMDRCVYPPSVDTEYPKTQSSWQSKESQLPPSCPAFDMCDCSCLT